MTATVISKPAELAIVCRHSHLSGRPVTHFAGDLKDTIEILRPEIAG